MEWKSLNIARGFYHHILLLTPHGRQNHIPNTQNAVTLGNTSRRASCEADLLLVFLFTSTYWKVHLYYFGDIFDKPQSHHLNYRMSSTIFWKSLGKCWEVTLTSLNKYELFLLLKSHFKVKFGRKSSSKKKKKMFISRSETERGQIW